MVNRRQTKQATGPHPPLAAGLALLMLYSGNSLAAWTLNMPRGVTPISNDLYNLHMTVIGICTLIAIVVYSTLVFILVRHRRSRNPEPATFDRNSRLENLWTLIPFLILVVIAVPSARVLFDMEDAGSSDLTIKITGAQWKWKYEYLDHGIGFYSHLQTAPAQIQGAQPKDPWYLLEVDKPLVVPVGRKIRFLVTSSDVLHSWWVPAFGIKRDAVPGFVHEAWARISAAGTYRGQCAELCGVHHGFMPVVVKAVSPDEFRKWVGRQRIPETRPAEPWNLQTALEHGEDRYNRYCAPCHQSDGSGIPPMYPALKTSSVVVGDPLERHIEIVLNGVPYSAMQAFRDQLSVEDIAAIITWERNAWGGRSGDLVTPSQISRIKSSINRGSLP